VLITPPEFTMVQIINLKHQSAEEGQAIHQHLKKEKKRKKKNEILAKTQA
jgi:hypothetical protein